MYADYTMDAEGGLEGKSEDTDIPVMATGLYHQVQITEVNENYVNYSVMLPRGNTYARRKVIRQKRYSNENSVRRMKNKPILNTWEYRIEFDDEEVSKVIENVITESMYAECDDSGNEYSIMDLIVDNHNNDKAITVLD